MNNKFYKSGLICTYRATDFAAAVNWRKDLAQGETFTIQTSYYLNDNGLLVNPVNIVLSYNTTVEVLGNSLRRFISIPDLGIYHAEILGSSIVSGVRRISLANQAASNTRQLQIMDGRQEDYWNSSLTMFYQFLSASQGTMLVLSDSNIMGGVTYKQCINTEDDLIVGDAACAEISLETISTDIHVGDTLTYYIKQRNDNADRQIGLFIVDNIEKTATRYRITAYDFVSKFDKNVDAWWAGLTFPITIGNLFSSLCTYCSCTAYSTTFTNSTQNITNADVFNGLTGRQMLGMIAGAAGGFVTAQSDGSIYIQDFSGSSQTIINSSKYTSCLIADYDAPVIDQVNLAYSLDDVGVRYPNTEGTTYHAVLNILGNGLVNGESTEVRTTIATNIYNKVHNYQFTPATIELLEDYGLKAGDKISINNKTVFIFNKEMNSKGVVFTTEANAERSAATNKNAELNSLRGKYNILRDTVDEHYQELGEAQVSITALQQTALGLRVDVTDLQTDMTNTLTFDSNGLIVKKDSSSVAINGGNITLTGCIKFSDFSTTDLQTVDWLAHNGQIYRQSTKPTGTGIVEGALWLNTGNNITEGDITYYSNSWYSYKSGSWTLISNPSYITSTKITSTTVESPSIIGNDISVNADSGGAFKVKKNLQTIGFMGAGVLRSIDGQTNQDGVFIARDVNGNNIVDFNQDYYLAATDDNIRLQAGQTYIYVTSSGAYVVINGGTAIPLGYARFG